MSGWSLVGGLSLAFCVSSVLTAQEPHRAALGRRTSVMEDVVSASISGNASVAIPAACDPVTRRRGEEIRAGILGAWIVGLGAYRIVDHTGAPRRVRGDAGYSPDGNTAFAIGSWIGSVAGVHLRTSKPCRSLPRSVVGAGIPTIALLLGRHEPYLPLLGALFAVPLQAVGASVAR